jgi:ADP-ribosyl-[dinitrogen reductase] hydrolase
MVNYKGGATINKTLEGCLLGLAVGDALGLPAEGLTPARQKRLFGTVSSYRLFLGRGMVSDDTEHACMTVLAYLEAARDGDGDSQKFAQALGKQLKYWFLLLPPGMGMATARACIRLLLGVSPERSGVFSAGNGPAMRAPVLGALPLDLEGIIRFNRASARVTHSDPKAEWGALAIALATRHLARAQTPGSFPTYLAELTPHLSPEAQDFETLLEQVQTSLERSESLTDFASRVYGPKGISGYILHTVPACLHAAFSHPDDYPRAIQNIIACGGDTDTTAAIVGGMLGARVGREGIPKQWLAGIMDFPRDVRYLEALAKASPNTKPIFLWPIQLFRNLLLLFVILFHGFRRMFPPY